MCDWDGSAIPWCLVVTRALHFAACLLVFGLCFFDRFVAAPALEAAGNSSAQGCARLQARGWPILLALLVALGSGAAWLVLVAAGMADETPAEALRDGSVRTVWEQTRFGLAWQWRLLFGLVATAAAIALPCIGSRSRVRTIAIWIVLLSGAGLTAGLAWSGHGLAAEASALWKHGGADVLHLLVVGVWPVGLFPFAIALRRLRHLDAPLRWEIASVLTRRFSALSLSSVALLTGTGLVNSWYLVRTMPALTGTPYGKVLLFKVALFIGMIAIGAVNLLYLKPRISDARLPTGKAEDVSMRRLKWNVTAELLLGIGVIVAVALLGVVAPPE